MPAQPGIPQSEVPAFLSADFSHGRQGEPRGAGQLLSATRSKMPGRFNELIAALFLIFAVSGLYAFIARDGIPRSSGFFGLSLGIAGFLLMLSAETLYSLRKRVRGFHWGPMQVWLQTHVIAGLLGAYLAVLHSGFRFHGLAGVLMLVTMVIIVSGFIGRYIYTAVPRTVDGAAVGAAELRAREVELDAKLRELGIDWVKHPTLVAACALPHAGWGLVFGRIFWRGRCRRRLRRALAGLLPGQLALTAQLQRLLEQRFRLELQTQSLATTRQLLAWWHVLHVPLGLVQFTLLGLHIVGATWYLS